MNKQQDDTDFHEHQSQRLPVGETDETYAVAARLFKALADPERLKLMAILSEGEACVSELATKDQMSTVSQRLKTLRSENLVKNKRSGKHIIYELADHHVFELIQNALEHVKEKS